MKQNKNDNRNFASKAVKPSRQTNKRPSKRQEAVFSSKLNQLKLTRYKTEALFLS
jgi:hypothetical protein